MTTKQKSLVVALAVSILVAFAACRNPAALFETVPSSTNGTGTLSIQIQRVSPRVSELFSSTVLSKSVALPASKAFIATDRVHLTLLQNENFVSEWEEALVPPEETLTGLTADGVPGSFLASEHAVATGTGYTLQAELYNSLTDESTPVVAGQSASFEVTGENTESNPLSVSITCTPVNATALTKDVRSPSYELAVPWIGNESGVVSVGSEMWFVVYLDGATRYYDFEVAPDAGSSAYLGFVVYDSSGAFINSGAFDQNPGEAATATLDMGTTDAGTYYIGVIDAQMEGGEPSNGPFTLLITDSTFDPIAGDWKLDTVDGHSFTDPNYQMVENLSILEDNTWSGAYVLAGTPGTLSGTWQWVSAGSYTIEIYPSELQPEGSTALATLSADGETLSVDSSGSSSTLVRGRHVLPPTGLSAVDQSGDFPLVSLQWTPSLSPDVTEYRVWRREDPDAYPVTPLATVDASLTSYDDDDTGLKTDGTAYYYSVDAVAGTEPSPLKSGEVPVTPGYSGGVVIEIQ